MIEDGSGVLTIGAPMLTGVPTLPTRFLSRPRLLARLDAAADDPLIVLRGVGGSGKSALVADWLRRRGGDDGPAVWVSLDHGIGSRAAFWRLVARALARAGALAPGSALAGDEPANDETRLRALVVDELADGPAIRLVIDDFHHTDPAIAQDVAWVLERCSRLRVVASTRRREHFEDELVRARVDVTVLTTDDLAFTAEESAELVRQSADRSDPVLVGAIHDATRGHPLALRLAITAIGSRPDEDVETLAGHILGQTVRDFLPTFPDAGRRAAALRLAIAPYADVELARELTVRDDVDALVAEFEREGIGSRRVVNGAWWFSFHPLVSQALGHELGELDPEELVRMRMRTAEFLETVGDPIGAVQQFLAAEQFDAVWPLVARNFSELWNHFSTELESALMVVPRQTLRRHPTLAVSLIVIRAHREGVPSHLTRAIADEALVVLRGRLESCAPQERFLLLTAVLGAHRAVRRYAEAAEAAETLLAMIDRLPLDEGRRAIATIDVVLVQIAVGSMLNGRLDDALSAARRVSLDGNPWRAVHATSLAALVASIQGETAEARQLAGWVAARPRPHAWRGSYGSVGWHVAEAVSDLDRFGTVHADEVLRELDPELDLLDLWPYPVWARALRHLVAGSAEAGARELIAALAQHASRPASDHARDLLTGVCADLLLASGQPARARRSLGRQGLSSPPLLLSRSRLALSDGTPERVVAQLALVDGDENWTSRQRTEAQLLRAVASARLGRRTDAHTDLDRALETIDRTGARLPLVMVPHDELLTLLPAGSGRALVEAAPAPFDEPLRVTRLTSREREVLEMLASSTNLESVAGELFVSINTVKTQVRAIYRKLGVSSRADAIRVARRRGLLDD